MVDAFQPELAGNSDGFLIKIGPDGEGIEYATYLGGDDHDYLTGVALGADGSIYLTGYSYDYTGDHFPTKNPFQGSSSCADAIVVRMTPDAQALLYSSFLGAGCTEEARALSVSAEGTA